MKKFVMGLIVGVAITAAGAAYADDIAASIVGKTVQGSFPVKVDGKQLSNAAAVIDGTSYLPVRAIGEALNKEVSFDTKTGIELKEREVLGVNDPTKAPYLTDPSIPKERKIESLKDEISNIRWETPGQIIILNPKGGITYTDEVKKQAAEKLAVSYQQLIDLQKILDELQK